MDTPEQRIARWSLLVMRYTQRHGDVVLVMSAKGMLLARREVWQPWWDPQCIFIGPGDSPASVRSRLMAAHELCTSIDGRRPGGARAS